MNPYRPNILRDRTPRRQSLAALCAALLAPTVLGQDWPDTLWAHGGHAADIRAVVIAPDGQSAASVSADHTLKTWSLDTRTLRRTYRGGNDIRSAAYVPGGQSVVTGDGAGYVRIIRLADGVNTFSQLAHGGAATAVAISSDGQTLATGGDENGNNLKLWRVSDGAGLRILTGHSGDTRAIVFTPDNQYLISAGGNSDRRIRLWRVATGALVRTFNGGTQAHFGPITSISLSPDGQSLVSAGYIDVKLWTVSNGALARTITLTTTSQPIAAAFAPDMQSIAVGCEDGVLRSYRTSDGGLRWSAAAHTSAIQSIAFTPDAATIVTGSAGASVRAWQNADGAPRGVVSTFGAALTSVGASADGGVVLAGGGADPLRAFDGQSGTLLREFPGGMDTLCAAISPDGRWAAGGGEAGNHGELRLWRAGDGTLLHTINSGQWLLHPYAVTAVAFSPDNESFAYAAATIRVPGNASPIRVCRVSDANLRWTTSHADQVRALAFSPDGRFLASAGNDRVVKLSRVTDGALLFSRQHPGDVLSVAFSADSRRLATGSTDGGIRLWRTADGGLERTVIAPAADVRSLTFADGVLVSGRSDEHLMYHDPNSGGLLDEYAQETEYGVTGLAASADGATLALVRPDRALVVVRNPLFREPILGDVDRDHDVDLSDLSLMLSVFGMSVGGEGHPADVNGDGDVSLGDLASLLSNFGQRAR